MSYHHKHDNCARNAKDILSNMLRSRCDKYKLLGIFDTIKSASASDLFRKEDAPNPLKDAEDRMFAEEQDTETTSFTQTDCMSNSMEQYYTIMNTRFEDIETKDAYTKIRKRGGNIDSW